ncbi:MAG: CotS family spore coat protein [Heliobacteriaceae bacterium]|nr:CotS family spore coat protein [Heliobacteriaceae bacterium]MDD4587318.1 CotS family spore coat protein [Heliobacteriaceae bacterium]
MTDRNERVGLTPEVLAAFALNPRRIKPLRNAFRIETPEGRCVIKQCELSIKDLMFIQEAQHHLTKNGFRRFAALRINPQGSLLLEIDGTFWVSTNWVEGRECDYDHSLDITTAVKGLAEFHLAARGFSLENCAERNYWGKWPQIFANKIKQMEECQTIAGQKQFPGLFDHLYLKHIDQMLATAREALLLLEGSAYQRLMQQEIKQGGFCHHDPASHNIIIGPNGQAYFLDFDYCLQDTRLHDLASLLIRVLKRHHWSLKKAFKVVDAYHQVYAVASGELAVMLCFIAFPNDFWQYGWAYYKENLNRPPEFHYRRLKRFANNLQNRRRFLRMFAKELLAGG